LPWGVGPAATCGPPPTVNALWASADGVSWSRLTLPADFLAAAVSTVDGGSTGFIATGVLHDGKTQAVWLSADARSWRTIPLAQSTFGEFVVDAAVNFAGGYIVSGAVKSEKGCGEVMMTPSLWWSADGNSWTRSQLSGASSAGQAQVTLTRISSRAVMAYATEWDEATQISSTQVWVTADGRTWQPIASPSVLLRTPIYTDGRRGVSVADPLMLSVSQSRGPLVIATVGDDLATKTLVQAGDGPVVNDALAGWRAALGPTGVLIFTHDGLQLWLGVPTAS
jgi:hypothetical protein